MGAPSHEPPATNYSRVGCASDRRRQPGQQLDQPAGGASNKSTKVERDGRLEAGSRSTAWRCDAAGPGSGGAASLKGRPAGEREGGVGDRKEETAREIEEQRALYTRAKRREAAMPDRGGAKPEGAAHRQRDYRLNSDVLAQKLCAMRSVITDR
jgi:hypothetical protein